MPHPPISCKLFDFRHFLETVSYVETSFRSLAVSKATNSTLLLCSIQVEEKKVKSTSALVTGSGEDVVLLILSTDSNAFHMDSPRSDAFHVDSCCSVAPEMCSS